MTKIIVALLVLICATVSAQAMSDDEYVSVIRSKIVQKASEIQEADEMRIACKISRSTKSGCESLYKVIIARRNAELAELELMIVGISLNQDERDIIHKDIIPSDVYNSRKDQTNQISRIAKQMYPSAAKSSVK